MNDPELPQGWEALRLADAVEPDAPIIYGILQPGPEQERGVPYVRPTEIEGDDINVGAVRRTTLQIAAKYRRAALKPDDVVLSIVGTIGKVALVPPALDGANITQSSARLRARADRVDPRFLAAALRSPLARRAYEAARLGTGVPRLNLADVRELVFPFPPLEEQRGIATKLDGLRARSRRAKNALDAVPALLDRLRHSILAAAFRGDLTADWREQNTDVEPASELLKRIRLERRKRWEAGDVPGGTRGKYAAGTSAPDDPELPATWALATWSEVGFCQNGRAYPSAEYRDQGVRLLRPGNLGVDGELTWTVENTKHMDEAWAAAHPGHVVGRGEIVMNLTAQSLKDEFLGRVCLTRSDERCLLNQRLARLTPVVLDPRFVLFVFKSPRFRAFVDELNTGSLIQHMFTSQVEDFAFPIPPLAEQQEIVAAVDRMTRALGATRHAAASAEHQLAGLDGAVLAAAFRGELVAAAREPSASEGSSAALCTTIADD